jgi:hypothetical protein
MQGTDDPLGRDSWAMLNFGAKALGLVSKGSFYDGWDELVHMLRE